MDSTWKGLPAVPQCRNIIPIYGFLPPSPSSSRIGETVAFCCSWRRVWGFRRRTASAFCSLDNSGQDMSDQLDVQGGLCTGTDRHDGSIEEQRGLLTLDRVKGSNKGTSMDGLNGWMDITWLHICMRKERHSAEGDRKGMERWTPRFKDIFSSRGHRAGPFSGQGTCVSLCVCAGVCLCFI